MNDCVCGKPVVLRVARISVNRRRGVAHWIEHADGTPMHGLGWECAALKPYPKNEADKPYRKLLDRWAQHTRMETETASK
jgi:hypothetical protein